MTVISLTTKDGCWCATLSQSRRHSDRSLRTRFSIFLCRCHEIGINARERAGRAASDLTPAYTSPFISPRGAYRLFSALLPYPVSVRQGGNDGGAGIKETNPVCGTI